MAYPIKITYQTIPINKKLIHVFSLFDKMYTINSYAFIIELSGLFQYISSKYNFNEDILFYYESVNDFFNDLNNIEKIGDLASNIVVLTTFQ